MNLHLIEVLAVRHLGGYRLRVGFSDGSVKDVDLSNHLKGPVFEPLKDYSVFSQVRVDPEIGTITWPNGADVAPDTLYLIGVPAAAAA